MFQQPLAPPQCDYFQLRGSCQCLLRLRIPIHVNLDVACDGRANSAAIGGNRHPGETRICLTYLLTLPVMMFCPLTVCPGKAGTTTRTNLSCALRSVTPFCFSSERPLNTLPYLSRLVVVFFAVVLEAEEAQQPTGRQHSAGQRPKQLKPRGKATKPSSIYQAVDLVPVLCLKTPPTKAEVGRNSQCTNRGTHRCHHCYTNSRPCNSPPVL